jgi:hypothetical protein
MSYLDYPRITIGGQFYTDPSTIDNDPAHYEPDCTRPSPWQEPNGKHDFKLMNCSVRSALDVSGQNVAADAIIGASVRTTDSPTPAKIADLDVYQQNVPTIYGLKLKIELTDKTVVIGTMDQASLNGLQFTSVLPTRGYGPFDQYTTGGSYGGDSYARGVYQTVIRVPAKEWPTAETGVLLQLRSLCEEVDGNILLSFRFVVDAYINNRINDKFCTGRFIGTIGPQKANEPYHCPGQRWLQAREMPKGQPIAGTDKHEPPDWWIPHLYSAPFKLDESHDKLVIDLSNSICKTAVAGPFVDMGQLSAINASTGDVLGSVNFSDFVYENGGGICEVALTAAQRDAMKSSPLAITTSRTDIGPSRLFNEADDGLSFAVDTRFIEAPEFTGSSTTNKITGDGRVVRLPGQTGSSAVSRVHITEWGKPLADKQLSITTVSVKGTTKGITVPPGYPGNTSQADGALSALITSSDQHGFAQVDVRVNHNPGQRTDELDGQLYYLVVHRPEQLPDLEKTAAAQEQQISCLAWSDYIVKEQPVWEDVRAMMAPYMKLFPAMKQKIDLTDQTAFTLYASTPPFFPPGGDEPNSPFFGVPRGYKVLDRITGGVIPFLFSVDPESDSRFMPVTRDLSPAKIQTILNFIQNSYFPPREDV